MSFAVPTEASRASGQPWVQALRRWYAGHRRALPWRERPSPYRVWVSEIMLQQTQVNTVVPYFRRFMRAFPSFRALAEADLQSVLKQWEGLGYYARARHLHRAAQQIVGQLRGRVPRTATGLRQCPGVGEYTAAAIASICFGEAAPVVDGNVLRVFARFLGIRTEARSPAVRRRIATFLEACMPSDSAGDFNQAIMEVGALVCRPRRPACSACPLGQWCEANRRDWTDRIPVKRDRHPVPHRHVAAALVQAGGRVLLVRRQTEGLLGGLWEFPTEERRAGEALRRTAFRAVRNCLDAAVRVDRRCAVLHHAYSHFTVTVHVFPCRTIAARARIRAGSAAKRVPLSSLDGIPMSSVNRRLARMLQASSPAVSPSPKSGTTLTDSRV